MQNFYAPPDAFSAEEVTLTGDEYFHAARSCRVRPGEIVGVTDGRGRRVEARIASIDHERLTAEILRDVSGIGEPAVAATVALALIQPSRFEFAVEKCTELGARRFVPVVAERCTVKPGRLKPDRLRTIALAAMKQAGRSWLPEIAEPAPLREVLSYARGTVLAALRNADRRIGEVVGTGPPMKAATLLVGPEGDFTDDERAFLIEGGAVPVSLGGLTLRSETAAVAGVSILCDAVRQE